MGLTASVARTRDAHHRLLAVLAILVMLATTLLVTAGRPQTVLAAVPPPFTVSFVASDKPYDGNTNAVIESCEIVGSAFGATCVPVDEATGSFDHPLVAENIQVTAAEDQFDIVPPDGAESPELWVVGTVEPTAADITKRDLTADATGVDRGYDGSTAATVTFTDDRVVGDDLEYAYSATFDDRNAGNGKPITVTGISISGFDALNYNLLTTADSHIGRRRQRGLDDHRRRQHQDRRQQQSAAAIPSITGTIFSPDVAAFIETYDTALAGSGKTLTPEGEVNDGNDGDNYSYDYIPQNNGQIRPGPAASLTFTAQPIETETNTPIYNTCVPSGGTAPCALAGVSGSTPVQVTAKDLFGNLAGPGSPGADGTTAPISVTIKKDSSGGSTLGSASTSNGVAAFGDALKIVPTGNTKLHAGTTAGTSPTQLSSQFAIVNDLEACDNQLCDNNASNGKAIVQKAFGKITTGSDFFTPSTNVRLSTQFVPGSQVTGRCGNNQTIGDATDLLVAGAGAAGTAPVSTMVLVLPKDTLKALGITSRGVPNFNVCLGALDLSGSVAAGWKAKGTGPGGLITTVQGAEGRYWGTPADCGTAGLSASDPCIALRTKQAATAQAYLGMTAAEFAALGIKDADMVIIIRKQSPWDAKGGSY